MAYGHRAFAVLVDIIGELEAERLSIECGGRYFYLGMREDKAAEKFPDLVRCLGIELTQDLIHYYPSPELEIPLYGKIRARNRMILRLSDRMSIAQLARITGLSGRMVRSILSSARTEFDNLRPLTQACAS
jgi:hypothetical protein